jgi:hypothetical protein
MFKTRCSNQDVKNRIWGFCYQGVTTRARYSSGDVKDVMTNNFVISTYVTCGHVNLRKGVTNNSPF